MRPLDYLYWAADQKTGLMSADLLLVKLAARVNDDGEVIIGQDELCEILGRARSTVWLATKHLETSGLISKTATPPLTSGRYGPYRYKVLARIAS